MTPTEKARLWLSQEPLFVDTETTGLSPRDEVVQVAIVSAQGEPLLNTLVKPTRPIPLEVVRIHGITDDHVRGAPTGAEVSAEVARLLKGRLVCSYNADFDRRLLAQTARIWKVPAASFRTECVMHLYADYAGRWDARHGCYRWFGLGVAAQQCGLGGFHEHDALADACITARILQHIATVERPIAGQPLPRPMQRISY